MRPTTGILRCSFRYSRSDASVSMDMTEGPPGTLTGSKPTLPASKASARSPLASTSQASTRRPDAASSHASPAAIVVLPVPPLPVTNRSRRSSMVLTRGAPGPRRAPAAPLRRAEPDAALPRGRTHLDVGTPGAGPAASPSAAVREPQHRLLCECGLHLGDHGLAIGVLRQLD